LVPDAAMLNAYDPKTGELLSKDAIKLDDKRLAGVSGDGTLVVLRDVHTISILSTKDGTRMAELPDGSSQEFSFSPNGETVAGIGEGILRVWRLRDAKLLCEVTVPGRSDLMWRDSKRILMSNGSQLQILQVTPCPESLQSDAGGGRVTSSVSNYFASFDARGQRLIYVDKAGRIEVRSARTLEIERVFDTFDYKQSPYNATVGIDTVFGRVGIGNEGGGEVTVWELGSGKQLTTIDSGLDKVASLTFSRTGEHLAVGSWDGGLNILSIADPTTSTIFRDDSGRGRGVGAVDFHPDGTRIAAGIGDDVVLFQLDPPKTLWKNSYGNSVKSVRFDHTGETLYVGTHRYGTSDTLKVLDATTGRERSKLFGHEESVEWITLRPDGKMLASGGGEGTIRLWEMPSGEPVAVLLGAHRGEIKSLSFSPDGTMLLSAGGDEVLRLWDVAESQSAAMYTLNNSIKLQATQDGILYAFSGDGRYQALDIGTQVVTVQGTIRPGDKEDNLPPLAVSGDGTKVAAAASSLRCVGGKDPNCQVDEKIYYHDLPANRSLGVLDGHEDGVDALAFSRDASMLAYGGHKGDLKIWNLSTQEARILRFATGSRDRIEALAFGAGDTILAVARARAVSIIDIVSGTETGALKGHRNTVQKIAVSRDGRLLASGDGNEVLVWDMTSRRLIVRLSHPGPYVSELAFGPGDRLLAAAGSRSARVWSTRRWDDWVDVNPSASQALAFSADGKVLFTTRSGNFWETIRVVDAWLIDNALKPTDWRRDLAALDMSSSMEWRDVVSQLDEQITLPAPKWPPYTYLGLSDRVWDHGPNERIVRHLLQRGALEGARHALRSAPQLQANKDLVDALVVAHIEAIRQLPTKHALPVLRAAVSLAPSHARLRIVIAIMIVQMLSEAEKNGESDAADRLLLEEAAQHFQRAEELGLDPLRFLNRMKGTMVDEPLYTELMEALRTLKEAPSNSTPANGNRAKP
jgi:WD40 repeat protein